jgi:molecular chaperone HtpG
MNFNSELEKKANEASNLQAFSRVNLPAIKDVVQKLSAAIGRDGIFREYTLHDITHIDKLLELLDWIVPTETMSQLTAADCLMTTLAVYFHDLGMIVTKSEYENRASVPSFKDFRERAFAGAEGRDYQDKLSKLSPDEAERFLYQEFVRENHATRVRAWVEGKEHIGRTPQVNHAWYVFSSARLNLLLRPSQRSESARLPPFVPA